MRHLIVLLLLSGCGPIPAEYVQVSTSNSSVRFPVCGQSFVVTDWGAPQTTYKAVSDSVRYWTNILGRRVLIHAGRAVITDADQKPPYLAVREPPDWILEEWRSDKYPGGSYDGIRGEVREHLSMRPQLGICTAGAVIYLRTMPPGYPYVKRLTTAMHEFGHVLGLVHSVEKGTLMYWNMPVDLTALPYLGDDSRRELRAFYGDLP
jgi:hypothetical protein